MLEIYSLIRSTNLDDTLNDSTAFAKIKGYKAAIRDIIKGQVQRFGDLKPNMPEPISTLFYKFCHFVSLRPFIVAEPNKTYFITANSIGHWEENKRVLLLDIRNTPAGISLVFEGTTIPYEIVEDNFIVDFNTLGTPTYNFI